MPFRSRVDLVLHAVAVALDGIGKEDGVALDQAAQVFDVVPLLFGALLSQRSMVLLDERQLEAIQMRRQKRWIGFHEFALGS